MFEVKNEDNIITICFEDVEDLFSYSEACYNRGLNTFPYFLHREKVLNTPYIGHYHDGVEEKRPHLHIAKLHGDELQITMELLSKL